MALPAGLSVAIEWVAGTWTDVSSFVDDSTQVVINFGRTSVQSKPQPGTLTLRLDNTLGYFTPKRQVLFDGVTANPYWPNIIPRKRIRVTWTIASTTYTRFLGEISGFAPIVDADGKRYVDISATDITNRLSRVTLQSPLAQAIADSGAVYLWPMTDPSSATAAIETAAGSLPLTPYQVGAGGTITFGGNGPGSGEGSGVAFAPVDANNGRFLYSPLTLAVGGFFAFANFINSAELYFQAASAPAAPMTVLSFTFTNATIDYTIGTDGHLTVNVCNISGTTGLPTMSAVLTTSVSVCDGSWHSIGFSTTSTFGPPSGTYFTHYLDGVALGNATSTSPMTGRGPGVYVGGLGGQMFSGSTGYLSIYSASVGADFIKHFQAERGYAGDTTGQRIQRVLAFAGLTSSDWNVDTGKAIVNSYPQAGKSVLEYCQDMADTEGGGAVFYGGPSGLCRFADRTFRKPGAPVLTIDALGDMDGATYSPVFDETTLQNQVVVSRSSSSGSDSSQTWTDQDSVDQYQLSSSNLTTYTVSDLDALHNAQQIVAENAYPGFRFDKIGVDLFTAQNNLYVQVAGIEIGSRIRLTGIPAGVAPATQNDSLVEGWTETWDVDTYEIVFDTSPADNPARAVLNDTTYGRANPGMTAGSSFVAPAPTIVLSTAVNSTATTLVFTGTAGYALFTSASASYPLNVKLDEEVITLTAPPSTSGQVQTFTGVTRGALGTPKAAHVVNTVPGLYPAATVAL